MGVGEVNVMAQCASCKTETELYNSGVPVCIKCSEEQNATQQQTRNRLLDDTLEATALYNEARAEFEDTASRIPSGLAHPDGIQRIKNASHGLSIARKKMMKAHSRLDEFLQSGIVPEDLKRSG
jgi:hypothetical protein